MITIGDDEFASSDEENYDSDRIDSDIEAELYGTVHHEADKSTMISDISCSSSPVKNLNIVETSLQSSNFKNFLSNSIRDKTCISSYQSFQVDSSLLNSDDKNIYCHNINNNNSSNFGIDKASFISKFLNTFEYPDSNLSSKRKFKMTKESNKALPQTKKQKKSNRKINNSKKTEALDCDIDQVFSDEESDIICLGPSNQNNLQTNLSQNVVLISSDSCKSDSDSDIWCYASPNNSDYNLDRNRLKEQWFINDEDKYRSRRNSGRYHESKVLNCNNCYEKGHLARYCPNFKVPKCYICGSRHRPSQCMKRICGKCYRIGHSGKYCIEKFDYCFDCRMPGHRATACPDIWRRYNLTTTKNFVRPKKCTDLAPLYCYNCGHSGHFGGVCAEQKMIMNTFPTWPCVISFKKAKHDPLLKINKNEKRANKIIDENSSLQKPDSFVDKFLEDKEQAMREIRTRKRNDRMKKKPKKSERGSYSEILKKNISKLFQESKVSKIQSQKIKTTSKDTLPFPRTPKKNLNSSQESGNSEMLNQSNKILNKQIRRARNQRRRLKKKTAKLAIKNRLLAQAMNNGQ